MLLNLYLRLLPQQTQEPSDFLAITLYSLIEISDELKLPGIIGFELEVYIFRSNSFPGICVLMFGNNHDKKTTKPSLLTAINP